MLGIIVDFTDIPTAPNNYSFPFFPCPSHCQPFYYTASSSPSVSCPGRLEEGSGS